MDVFSTLVVDITYVINLLGLLIVGTGAKYCTPFSSTLRRVANSTIGGTFSGVCYKMNVQNECNRFLE